MRLSYLLPFALSASLLACGGESGSTTSDAPKDSDDNPITSGPIKDGGTKDSGKGGSPGSSGSDGAKPGTTQEGDDDDDDGAPACDKLNLTGAPQSPDILIVLDRSGSMVGLGDMRNMGKNRWVPSVSAVKKLTSSLTETVAFGLMLFPHPDPMAMGGGGGLFGNIIGGGMLPDTCQPGQIDVPVGINTADKIAAVLDMSMPDFGSTPTTASLMAARTALGENCTADCKPTPKYILLVTDGQPTCGMGGTGQTTPEDIAATNAAIDDLTMDGVKTYVIGYDTASDPDAAAAMDGFAMHGGTDKHYPVEDEATLIAELTRIAGALVPCEFELNKDVPDPAYVRVEIDGTTFNYGTDWTLNGRTVVLDPMGGACPTLRDAKVHNLKITRECEVIPVL
jgi:hypothetical protein